VKLQASVKLSKLLMTINQVPSGAAVTEKLLQMAYMSKQEETFIRV
jgi:hypothetical protein